MSDTECQNTFEFNFFSPKKQKKLFLEVTISRVTFNKFFLACKYLGKFEEMKRF